MITLCFVFLIFSPVLEQIEKDSKETVSYQQTLRALKIRQTALSQLREDHRELEERLEKMENLFLDSENPLGALDYLEETAEASGVEINTSALSFSRVDKPWPSFSVQISLTSDFANLMRFIDRLENSPGLVKIENPSFKKTGDQVWTSFLVKFFTPTP